MKNKKKFRITATETICHSWIVEAESEEKAEDLAMEMCPCNTLPPSQICAKNDYQTDSIEEVRP